MSLESISDQTSEMGNSSLRHFCNTVWGDADQKQQTQISIDDQG